MKKLLIVTLTIALIFALATCDKGDDTSPCNCLTTYGTTAHLGMNETCTCGGTDCTACTEQTDSSYNIPIRKVAGVTVQQMNDTVALIKTAMELPVFANKDLLAELITEIHIVSGNTANYQNGIMTVGYGADFDTIGEKLYEIYAGIA